MENNQPSTLIAIAVIVIAGGALWYFLQTPAKVATTTPPVATSTAPVASSTAPGGTATCTNCFGEADNGATVAFTTGSTITLILPDSYNQSALSATPAGSLTHVAAPAAPAGMWAASFMTAAAGTANIVVPGASRNTAPYALNIITVDAAHSWENGMTVVQKTDTNQTINLALHQRFILMLGSDLNWTEKFAPASAITRVADSASGGGIQGVFEADQAGTATLTALGAPICAKGQACPQFLINITVNFVIQ